ncbi:MAG: DUF6731 family protein [Terriglobia bacterium]
MRKVRFDIFQPGFEDPAQNFEAFLQRITHLRKERRLRRLSKETMLYMPNPRHGGSNLWSGELQHIKMTNLPDRIDLSTLVDEALGLPEGEGLVDRCHFAYRTDLGALALQASRLVRPSMFEAYIPYVAQIPFHLAIIPRGDAYPRLTRLRKIASINVRIANPPDSAEFTSLNDPGVSGMAEMLFNFGNAKIDVTVKRANRSESLIFDNVKAFIDRVRGRQAVFESFEALSITGKKEDDEKLEPVDFIKDRMTFEGDVDYDSQRRLDPNGCEAMAVEALLTHEPDLRRYHP